MLVSIPGLNDDNLKLYHKMVNNFNTSLKQLMWEMFNLKITLAVNCRDFYLNHSPSTLLDLNKKKLRASSFLGKDLFGEVVLEKGLDDSNLEVKRRCDQALLSHVFKQSENIPSAVMQQPSSVQKQQPSVQTEVFAGTVWGPLVGELEEGGLLRVQVQEGVVVLLLGYSQEQKSCNLRCLCGLLYPSS